MDELQPLRQVQEQMNREDQQDRLRFSGQRQGMDRHDYYNIQFAAELEGAMGRARQNGFNINQSEQVLKFLEKEEAQARPDGKGSDAVKRPLSDRYREFVDRTRERDSLLKRGVPEKLIPSVQLYESFPEQQVRLREQYAKAIDESQ